MGTPSPVTEAGLLWRAASLPVLAQGSGRWGADRARSEAREILSDRRFRGVDPPRPLRGVMEGIGRWVRRAFENVADLIPGGEASLWTLLALAVVMFALGGAILIARRRTRAGAGRPGGEIDWRGSDDPARLEREAEEAERRGQLDRAIRLRFRAGLLRLGRMGALEWNASLTSGEVSRRLGLRVFDNIAGTFDEIVYGRRPPTAADIEESRTGWEGVLTEVSR